MESTETGKAEPALASREGVASLRDEDLIELFSRRLPDLLERRPELEPELYRAFLKTFARRDDVALVLAELRALGTEMNRRFDQVDQRVGQVDQRVGGVDQRVGGVDQRVGRVEQRVGRVEQRVGRVEQRLDRVEQRVGRVERELQEFRAEVAARFEDVQRAIDRLGARWGIRNESVFRQTMAAVLEQSFGVRVEQRTIAGEQFDVLIYDHQHILVEIAASVGRAIGTRLERKRRLYEEHTGVRPARIILATASIHSRRAEELRHLGIEVIEPEESEQELLK